MRRRARASVGITLVALTFGCGGYRATSGSPGDAGLDGSAGDGGEQVPALSESQFFASPDHLVANGRATSTLTLLVKDAAGVAIPNLEVSFSVNGESYVLAPHHGMTDASGTLIAYLASTKAQTISVSANVGGITLSVNVLFAAPSCTTSAGRMFSSPMEYPTGQSTQQHPAYLAAADLNGDGRPDLVFSEGDDDTVSLALNQGDGAFQINSPITVGSAPGRIIAADVNGDSLIDIVVLNRSDNTVSILLGDGMGGLTEQSTRPRTGVNPDSFIAGDFNEDGHIDFAVTDRGDDKVTILLGDGTGTRFTEGISVATGGSPSGIAAGDFNTDGHTDLAIVSADEGSAIVAFGDGTGKFSSAGFRPFAAGQDPNIIVSIDVNGDAQADLVISNFVDNSITILLGDGIGNFKEAPGSPFGVDISPISITAGDFDNDGNADIVAATWGGNDLLIGDGTGSFRNASVSPFYYPPGLTNYQIVAGTFSGGARLDLVQITADSLLLFENQCR